MRGAAADLATVAEALASYLGQMLADPAGLVGQRMSGKVGTTGRVGCWHRNPFAVDQSS